MSQIAPSKAVALRQGRRRGRGTRGRFLYLNASLLPQPPDFNLSQPLQTFPSPFESILVTAFVVILPVLQGVASPTGVHLLAPPQT